MPSSPKDNSTDSSNNGSRSHSVSGHSRHGQPRPRHNVKFSVQGADEAEVASPKRHSLPELRLPEYSGLGEATPVPVLDVEDWKRRKDAAALTALEKASRHANRVKRHYSASASRRNSFEESSTAVGSPYVPGSPIQKPTTHIRLDDIPLSDMGRRRTGAFDLPEDDTDEDSEPGNSPERLKPLQRQDSQHLFEAERLMRTFTNGPMRSAPAQHRSGSATPLIDQKSHEYDYVPRPEAYKPSILTMLLASRASNRDQPPKHETQQEQLDHLAAKLAPFQDPRTDPRQRHADFFQARRSMSRSPGNLSGTQTPLDSSGASSSGHMTPKQKRPKWYKDHQQSQSTGSLGKLLESSFNAAAGPAAPESTTTRKPALVRNASSGRLSTIEILKRPLHHLRTVSSSSNVRRDSQDIRMADLAERLASQQYIIDVCKALMSFGAPTHRLEEYLAMAARKLQIQASFQYLPNCMIISFDDPDTHTTELKLVKEPTAVDLGKLLEVQEVYKDVMHNQYSLGEAMDDLREIRDKRKRFNTPTLIIMYGLAAVAVGPFAFSARPIDFPINFILGCTLGALQLGLAARSSQFSHIFEVFGTFVTSFAARGFGSILTSSGQPLFCFSALAQSSIALILPGWIILSAALELQSRNLIAGSIRMVYAIIYTLFLGFGILIGTTMMGLIYPSATNEISCPMPSYWIAADASENWKLIYTKFIWVPIFTVCLAVINQAKFKQMPWMIFIAFCGYQVNYWSTLRFSQNIQVANALGAFVIGVLANGYSRFRHGVAAAAMLPAIFVMVPSGLAASGSLVAGLTSANQITRNVTGISIINNGTQGFYDAQNAVSSGNVYNGTIFNVGYGMVQVAIGISVGLFLSALVIYPFGKKRSGIFSF